MCHFQWIPVFRGGSLQAGRFDLPVMLDYPPSALRYIPTDAAAGPGGVGGVTSGGVPPGTKWVDNKKPIFTVDLIAASTVHPLDLHLDSFLNLTATLQLGQNSAATAHNERAMEEDLLKRQVFFLLKLSSFLI
jgi:hypothetical protein